MLEAVISDRRATGAMRATWVLLLATAERAAARSVDVLVLATAVIVAKAFKEIMVLL